MIRLETPNPDSIHDYLIMIASEMRGYVASSDGRVTTINIPSTNMKSAISQIEKLGKVMEKYVGGRDVTEEYQDLEMRIENAEKSRQRYLELLTKATTVEEILLVEKELERLNGEIELLKTNKQRLSQMISYASVTVRTTNSVKPGPLGHIFHAVYKGLKWLFVWE